MKPFLGFLGLVGTYFVIGITCKAGEDLWNNFLKDKVMDMAENLKNKNTRQEIVAEIES